MWNWWAIDANEDEFMVVSFLSLVVMYGEEKDGMVS